MVNTVSMQRSDQAIKPQRVISLTLMRAQLRSIINPQINECQWEQGVHSPIRKIQYNYINLRAHVVNVLYLNPNSKGIYTITKFCKSFAKKWEWSQQHTNKYLNISYWYNTLAWVFKQFCEGAYVVRIGGATYTSTQNSLGTEATEGLALTCILSPGCLSILSLTLPSTGRVLSSPCLRAGTSTSIKT